jgi:hypothetical protein
MAPGWPKALNGIGDEFIQDALAGTTVAMILCGGHPPV